MAVRSLIQHVPIAIRGQLVGGRRTHQPVFHPSSIVDNFHPRQSNRHRAHDANLPAEGCRRPRCYARASNLDPVNGRHPARLVRRTRGFATDPVSSENGLPKCDLVRSKSDFTEAWILQDGVSRCGDRSSRARITEEGDNTAAPALQNERSDTDPGLPPEVTKLNALSSSERFLRPDDCERLCT
jgi:hypothetical protein